MATIANFEQLEADFTFLDEWEDRYRYLIELGRDLPPLDDYERTPATKVQGCVSQVWIKTDIRGANGKGPILSFRGDSDAHIVRGLIAILLTLFSGKQAVEIIAADTHSLFARLGLNEHLTPQRSNGLAAMVKRIKQDAAAALISSPGWTTSRRP